MKDEYYPFTILIKEDHSMWIRSTLCGNIVAWYGKNIKRYHIEEHIIKDFEYTSFGSFDEIKYVTLPYLTNLYKLLYA